MRAKRYFWNMQHHRELDEKMGLLRRMPEPMAKLAESCGMDPIIEGTRGMIPIFPFDNLDKVLPEKMGRSVVYDYLSSETPHRFHRCLFGAN